VCSVSEIVYRKGAEAAETNDFFFAVERTAKKNRSAVSLQQRSAFFVDYLCRKRIHRPKGCAFFAFRPSCPVKCEGYLTGVSGKQN